ncbi:hypothetical protein DU504_17880 [Haloplanus salinus]|uniref:Uncharacterized protein n=1 Tax=Haloplanus salinus TaxID=1126245 RepID=A0A368N2A4_9EURY|nr:hypothetical protein DU504_17880 [Haloplanus salinus]
MVAVVSKHIFDILVCVRGVKWSTTFGGLCRLSIPTLVFSFPGTFGRNRPLHMVGSGGAILLHLSDGSTHVKVLGILMITITLAIDVTTAVRVSVHIRICEARQWDFGR